MLTYNPFNDRPSFMLLKATNAEDSKIIAEYLSNIEKYIHKIEVAFPKIKDEITYLLSIKSEDHGSSKRILAAVTEHMFTSIQENITFAIEDYYTLLSKYNIVITEEEQDDKSFHAISNKLLIIKQAWNEYLKNLIFKELLNHE